MTWRILLLALLLQVAPKASVELKGSIEGIVVRDGTNEPLDDARVLLMKTGENGLASPILTTSSDGKFVFRDIEPGSYLLGFTSDGFVRMEYGQRVSFGKGAPIELATGQAIKNIVMRLTPAGSVSGRIQDTDRNPIAGIIVHLLKYRYDASGNQTLQSLGTGQTDDRGEYRIFFVTPDRYLVSAGTTPGPRDEGNRTYGRNLHPDSYAYDFYPGVADAPQARAIEVLPGGNVSGINMSLRKQPVFRIRGRVIDSNTGKAPSGPVNIQLHYRNSDTGAENWTGLDSFLGGERGTYENGTFEFRGVIPGSYAIVATVNEPYSPDNRKNNFTLETGGIPVDVFASDVDGIQLVLAPGATIPGRVTGQFLEFWNVSTCRCPPNPTLLLPSANGQNPSTPGRERPFVSSLERDGTFHLENLMPGEYRLVMGGLLERPYYIKEARFGGVDILNHPLQFTGSETGPLEIAIGTSTGAIDGKIIDAQLNAVAGAEVVLVPDRNRNRSELFRAATTDKNGKFSMDAIAPGDYKLFAWDAIEPFGYFDPEVLQQAEPHGVSMHVGELASKQTFDLKAIPVP